MKKFFFLSVLAIASLLVACDDDDNYVKHLPAPVEQAFSQKYPGQHTSRWEVENGAYKGEFRNPEGMEVDTWFRPDGTWLRSETEIRPAALPQPVKDYVDLRFVDYYIEDADYIEMPQTSYYHLELEGRGDREVEINVYADGTPVEEMGGGNVDQNRVPDAVIAAFATRYPSVKVQKWEVEHGYYKAEFVTLERVEAEAYFTAEGVWAGTEYDYEGLLPVAIQRYLDSNYPTFRVDDIKYVQTSAGDYFKIEIELGEKELKLCLTADGLEWERRG